MDIRYLIVGTPFIVAFFYSLFWLKRWGAFNSPFNNHPKKIITKNEHSSGDLILEKIFFTKN